MFFFACFLLFVSESYSGGFRFEGDFVFFPTRDISPISGSWFAFLAKEFSVFLFYKFIPVLKWFPAASCHLLSFCVSIFFLFFKGFRLFLVFLFFTLRLEALLQSEVYFRYKRLVGDYEELGGCIVRRRKRLFLPLSLSHSPFFSERKERNIRKSLSKRVLGK